MNILIGRAAVIAAIVGLLWAAPASPVLAGVKDYEFQLLHSEVKKGDAVVTVRLIDKRSGKAVPDAVIFAKRIDMAPDSMEEMTTKISPMPDSEPGVYRFEANVTMAGHWQLSLGAKVQGETGTVESQLVIPARP